MSTWGKDREIHVDNVEYFHISFLKQIKNETICTHIFFYMNKIIIERNDQNQFLYTDVQKYQ